MSYAKEKEILRKKLLSKRLALTSTTVKNHSEKILNMLSKYIKQERIKTIHTYSSIKNEVLTGSFIASAEREYPDSSIEIAPAKASRGSIAEGQNYDLVIVPVLGFDRRGYRLGYGGGYYDKFLARNDCKLVVGLAYGISEIENMPVEPHDKKMDIIITEKEIIRPKY